MGFNQLGQECNPDLVSKVVDLLFVKIKNYHALFRFEQILGKHYAF
jgi:hypothetical protein